MAETALPLTEKQKACLRLVAKGMSSKEIAIDLGLSPKTVDTYVKQACDKLGVISRREAARLLDASDLSEKSLSELPELADIPAFDETVPHTGGTSAFKKLGIPPVGGSINHLNWLGKIESSIRTSLIGVALMLSILLIFFGLLKTFK